MASYNRVILIGNLTRDPELRYTPGGTAVTDVGLAVNDRVKRNDEWVEEVTFVDVTVWGKTAEAAAQHLGKGSPAMIEGRLKLDSWETNDGQKRSKLKVVADRVVFLGSPRQQERPVQEEHTPYSEPAATSHSEPEPAAQPAVNVDLSDIPF